MLDFTLYSFLAHFLASKKARKLAKTQMILRKKYVFAIFE